MLEIKFKSQRGGSLIVTLGLVIFLSVAGLIITTMIVSENRMQSDESNKQKAFYLAETGIEYAVKMLNNDTYWRTGVSDLSAGDGKFSITLEDSSGLSSLNDTVIVTSQGISGNILKTIKTRVTPGVWPKAISAGKDLDLSKGDGVITGDLHANKKIKIGSKYTINGDISEAPPEINPPVMDWNFYKAAAMAAGQYVEGDKKFTSAGSPYTGVWFITQDAEVEDNNVEFYGTLVVGNNCKIEKNNEKFVAIPPNYPALVVGNKLSFDKNSAEIIGLVYCEGDFEIKKNNLSIIGSLICLGTFENEKNNLSITFDAKYTTNVSGLTIVPSEGLNTVLMHSWQEF
jgi:hypothetical protein